MSIKFCVSHEWFHFNGSSAEWPAPESRRYRSIRQAALKQYLSLGNRNSGFVTVTEAAAATFCSRA